MVERQPSAIEASRATWTYLEGLDTSERLDLIADEQAVAHETPCSAVLAAWCCDELGLSKSEFGIFLAGSPVTKVNALYHKALEYDADKRGSVARSWCKQVTPQRIEQYGEPELGDASA